MQREKAFCTGVRVWGPGNWRCAATQNNLWFTFLLLFSTLMYGTKKTQQTVTYVGVASTTEVWRVGGGEGRSTTVAGVRYTLIGSSVSFSRPPILKIRNDLCFSIRSNTGGGGENGWRSGWRRSVVPCSLSFPLPSLFCFTGKVQFTDKLRELWFTSESLINSYSLLEWVISA